jgi:hypothetical protein
MSKVKKKKNKINLKPLANNNEIKLALIKNNLKEKDKIILALEKELEEKNKKILALDLLLLDDSIKTEDSELEKIKQNLIKRYNIDMIYIDNLKVIAHYRYSDNPRDEYSSYHSGELELSYDYVKDNNNVISVKYTADYNSSQSYENRYDPDVEFDSKLKVSPSNIKFDYDKDVNIEYTHPKCDDYDEDDNDESIWCDLMNKVLEEIECNANNFSEIVSSLTNNGKINI